MIATGQEGHVRWGYQTALSFRAWRFEGDTHGGSLTATVVQTDTFRLTQTPLQARVRVGSSDWRWPVADLLVEGLTVTVTCGPRERT